MISILILWRNRRIERRPTGVQEIIVLRILIIYSTEEIQSELFVCIHFCQAKFIELFVLVCTKQAIINCPAGLMSGYSQKILDPKNDAKRGYFERRSAASALLPAPLRQQHPTKYSSIDRS